VQYRIEEIKEKIEQKRGELTQNADIGGMERRIAVKTAEDESKKNGARKILPPQETIN
jgi:hypothetical protein